MYNRDCSPELDDVEGLAAAATKHLELLKQKDKTESSFIIEKIVRKLLIGKEQKHCEKEVFTLFLPFL